MIAALICTTSYVGYCNYLPKQEVKTVVDMQYYSDSSYSSGLSGDQMASNFVPGGGSSVNGDDMASNFIPGGGSSVNGDDMASNFVPGGGSSVSGD